MMRTRHIILDFYATIWSVGNRAFPCQYRHIGNVDSINIAPKIKFFISSTTNQLHITALLPSTTIWIIIEEHALNAKH